MFNNKISGVPIRFLQLVQTRFFFSAQIYIKLLVLSSDKYIKYTFDNKKLHY